MENEINYSEKLTRNARATIANMLKGTYARRTVFAQLSGERTLKPAVKEAADKYLAKMKELYS